LTDAVEKVADEVGRAVRSAFESLFSSRSSSSCLAGLASLARASNAPGMLDATDAQARHAVGVFSNGRQIWLARVSPPALSPPVATPIVTSGKLEPQVLIWLSKDLLGASRFPKFQVHVDGVDPHDFIGDRWIAFGIRKDRCIIGGSSARVDSPDQAISIFRAKALAQFPLSTFVMVQSSCRCSWWYSGVFGRSRFCPGMIRHTNHLVQSHGGRVISVPFG
jgi:hypothetical protein